MGDLVPGPRAVLRYLHALRAFIGIVVAVFLVSAALGYALPAYAPGVSDSLVQGLKDKADALSHQSPPVMMLGIFANNAVAALMAMLFGLIAGLFPIFFTISNGLVIGIVLEMTIVKMGASGGIATFLLGIVPHGILELPAVLVSTAIGLKLGYLAIVSVVKREDRVTAELRNGLVIFLFWIVPMLFLAAIIETFVTGALLAYFMHAPIYK